ncbi:MAG: BREX-1 system phosphatase PglZ type A, partial [Proteobacteria bacterium]|nr:BREX-1 system phosphatase PglZ type A [Pseudomonadota bacterium]
MAVDAEKVLQELKRRFSEPLPEFYRRHIIFWHDEEREFADRIGEIEIDGVKVVTLTENNAFTLKKLLAKDDVDSHYLVYCPVTFESDEANWLLNIELYSGEPFRADIHTIWLEEMGLGVQENLRILLKQYHKFFNAKERRVRFARFSKQINQSKDVCLGMMASICGCKELEPTSIIRAVLMGGLRIEDNEIYQRLVTYDVHELFWKMVKQ